MVRRTGRKIHGIEDSENIDNHGSSFGDYNDMDKDDRESRYQHNQANFIKKDYAYKDRDYNQSRGRDENYVLRGTGRDVNMDRDRGYMSRNRGYPPGERSDDYLHRDHKSRESMHREYRGRDDVWKDYPRGEMNDRKRYHPYYPPLSHDEHERKSFRPTYSRDEEYYYRSREPREAPRRDNFGYDRYGDPYNMRYSPRPYIRSPVPVREEYKKPNYDHENMRGRGEYRNMREDKENERNVQKYMTSNVNEVFETPSDFNKEENVVKKEKEATPPIKQPTNQKNEEVQEKIPLTNIGVSHVKMDEVKEQMHEIGKRMDENVDHVDKITKKPKYSTGYESHEEEDDGRAGNPLRLLQRIAVEEANTFSPENNWRQPAEYFPPPNVPNKESIDYLRDLALSESLQMNIKSKENRTAAKKDALDKKVKLIRKKNENDSSIRDNPDVGYSRAINPDVPYNKDVRSFNDFDEGIFHLNPRTKMYGCPFNQCKKEFPSLSRIKRHYIIHTDIKPFKCLNAECNRSFSRKDNMLQHYRVHCAYTQLNKR